VSFSAMSIKNKLARRMFIIAFAPIAMFVMVVFKIFDGVYLFFSCDGDIDELKCAIIEAWNEESK